MTADTKLLPLPEKVEVDKHLPTGVRIYAYDANTLKDYARANVAHATAPLQAEIEALRVEVAAQRTRADAMAGEAIKHESRADRLAYAQALARQLRASVPLRDQEDAQ